MRCGGVFVLQEKLLAHAVFTAGSIAAKINYRQKQFNPQRPRGTNGLELMG